MNELVDFLVTLSPAQSESVSAKKFVDPTLLGKPDAKVVLVNEISAKALQTLHVFARWVCQTMAEILDCVVDGWHVVPQEPCHTHAMPVELRLLGSSWLFLV